MSYDSISRQFDIQEDIDNLEYINPKTQIKILQPIDGEAIFCQNWRCGFNFFSEARWKLEDVMKRHVEATGQTSKPHVFFTLVEAQSHKLKEATDEY